MRVPSTTLNTLCLLALFLACPARYSIVPQVEAQSAPAVSFEAAIPVLEAGQRLSLQYGSRPPYTGPAFAKDESLSPDDAQTVIPYLIACESEARSVKRVDSNGFYSYGILQMQSSTAAMFNSIEGTDYDPMRPLEAVSLAEIAIEHGYLSRWSCARIEKVVL